MNWRIVDVAADGRYLRVDRQSLVVEADGAEIGRLPFSDINAVLVHANHAVYSHEVLRRLSEYEIPLVVCDARHLPVSVLVPLVGHHKQAGRVRDQISISAATKKRLWRTLVRKKVEEQARTLSPFDVDGARGLNRLAATVRAGDPDNTEARAARIYWERLFGPGFRRDRHQDGWNAHLNYGYIVLRSALARAVVAAGLVPALGIQHSNALNAFCLVDDLLEPFRPLVDRLVYGHRETWNDDLSVDARKHLADLITCSVRFKDGETDLFRVMTMVVGSLVAVYEGRAKDLELPKAIELCRQPELPDLRPALERADSCSRRTQ